MFEQTTLTNLPDELIIIIITFYLKNHDKPNMNIAISSRLRILTLIAIKNFRNMTISGNNTIYIRKINRLKKIAPKITELTTRDLYGRCKEKIIAIKKCFPVITKLVLINDTTILRYAEEIVPLLKKMHTLKIDEYSSCYNSNANQILLASDCLKHLSLYYRNNINLDKIIQKYKLKSLIIDGYYTPSDVYDFIFPDNFGNLSDLVIFSLSRFYHKDSNLIEKISIHCKKLKIIKLIGHFGQEAIIEDIYVTFFRRITNLVKINFNYHNFTDDIIDILTKNSPRLDSVELNGCGEITSKSLIYFTRLKHYLRLLTINKITGVDDEKIIYFSNRCFNVELLDMKIDLVTDTGLKHLFYNLKYLNCLSINNAKNITSESIKYFFKLRSEKIIQCIIIGAKLSADVLRCFIDNKINKISLFQLDEIVFKGDEGDIHRGEIIVFLEKISKYIRSEGYFYITSEKNSYTISSKGKVDIYKRYKKI
jgi:hypothetical protein